MKRKMFLLLICMAIIVILGACTSGQSNNAGSNNKPDDNNTSAKEPSKPKQQVVLKLTHYSSPTDTINLTADKFSAIVAEKTNGQVKVEVYPSGQLAKDGPAALTAVSGGTIDMTLVPAIFFTNVNPDWNVMNVPYLLDTPEEMSKLFKSSPFQLMIKKLEDERQLSFLPDGYFLKSGKLLWTKKPVTTLNDMKNMKIRIPAIKVTAKALEQQGALITSVPLTDVYMALSQGMVDGLTASVTTAASLKVQEQVKYATDVAPEPIADPVAFVINTKIYKRLSSELQAAVAASAAEAGKWGTQKEKDEANRVQQELVKAGVTFNTPSKELFKSTVKNLPLEMESQGVWAKGLSNEVLQTLNR